MYVFMPFALSGGFVFWWWVFYGWYGSFLGFWGWFLPVFGVFLGLFFGIMVLAGFLGI